MGQFKELDIVLQKYTTNLFNETIDLILFKAKVWASLYILLLNMVSITFTIILTYNYKLYFILLLILAFNILYLYITRIILWPIIKTNAVACYTHKHKLSKPIKFSWGNFIWRDVKYVEVNRNNFIEKEDTLIIWLNKNAHNWQIRWQPEWRTFRLYISNNNELVHFKLAWL